MLVTGMQQFQPVRSRRPWLSAPLHQRTASPAEASGLGERLRGAIWALRARETRGPKAAGHSAGRSCALPSEFQESFSNLLQLPLRAGLESGERERGRRADASRGKRPAVKVHERSCTPRSAPETSGLRGGHAAGRAGQLRPGLAARSRGWRVPFPRAGDRGAPPVPTREQAATPLHGAAGAAAEAQAARGRLANGVPGAG